MQQQIEMLQSNLAELTATGEANIGNLQNELESVKTSLIDTSTKRDEFSAANDAMQEEINNLRSNMAEATAAKEAEMGNLQLEMKSVQKQLNDAEDELLAEKESMQMEIEKLSAVRETLEKNMTILKKVPLMLRRYQYP